MRPSGAASHTCASVNVGRLFGAREDTAPHPRVFVSYRRDDAAAHAGRLYDALAARFGAGNVFMDVDAIGLGSDYRETIDGALESCDAAIALIGRGWLPAVDDEGRRRLDDPTVDLWYNPRDFVAPPPNTYGDSGRGILYAPGHVNVDTSLSKRFAVFGRSDVEFRWDAFNLFNHPGFGFPQQNFDSPTAGRITTTIVDNRSMQFSLKFNF